MSEEQAIQAPDSSELAARLRRLRVRFDEFRGRL